MKAQAQSKQRVTFRLAPDLVAALRELPNQTAYVERILREALDQVCPLCHGSGEVPGVHLEISNLKRMPRLDRTAAAQLQALVRLGRQLMATELALEASREGEPVAFRLAREDQLLLTGRIPRGERELTLAN